MKDDFQIILDRYRGFIFHKTERHYLQANDRDKFLFVMKVPLNNYLLNVVNDPYMMELYGIFSRGRMLNSPTEKLLLEAEKCRAKWKQQLDFGSEYNQPFVPVDDFVRNEKKRDISKFIITVSVAEFFLKLISNLEKARKRGGLREREELSIIRKAKEENKIESVHNISELGFEWGEEKSEIQIQALYNKLLKRGYVDKQTSPEQFSQVFYGQPVEFPVVWRKTSTLLLYLIDKLLDHGLLFIHPDLETKRVICKELLIKINRGNETEDEKAMHRNFLHEVSRWQYERMAACFVNENGEAYSSNKLKHTRNTLSNRQGVPASGGEVEKIVEDIAKMKK